MVEVPWVFVAVDLEARNSNSVKEKLEHENLIERIYDNQRFVGEKNDDYICGTVSNGLELGGDSILNGVENLYGLTFVSLFKCSLLSKSGILQELVS